MSLERLTPYSIVKRPPAGGVRRRRLPSWVVPLLSGAAVVGFLLLKLAFLLGEAALAHGLVQGLRRLLGL
jgi:hypothetical protein